MATDVIELERELRELTARVDALESTPRSARDENAVGHVGAPSPIVDDDAFWALNGLNSRRAEHPTTADGEVMIIGSLTLPTGAPVSWQQSVGTEGLLETEWHDQAAVFAALGHPVRLELLRHILSGTRSTAELAEMKSLGTTGQLHHHLRQLVTSGWVRQSGRGTYDVPAARIVPLLACLLGSER